MESEKKRLNKWKIAFLALAFVNVSLLIYFSYLFVKITSTNEAPPLVFERSMEEPTFTVVTSKEKVSKLINNYLDSLLIGEDYHYSIVLDEHVVLHGELPLLSTILPITMKFEPIVLESGDIVFKQQSISIGQLQLPNEQAMKLLSQFIIVPDWVHFDPEREQIYVQITEVNNNGVQFRMETFDLINDEISFHIDIAPNLQTN